MSKKDIDVYYSPDQKTSRTEYVDNKNKNYEIGSPHEKEPEYRLHSTRPYVLGTVYIWKTKRK